MTAPGNVSARKLAGDYLADLTHVALRYLPKGDRAKFVGRTKAVIERRCGPLAEAEPNLVAAVLAELGEPRELVMRERQRLDTTRAKRRSTSGVPAAPWEQRPITSRWRPATGDRRNALRPGRLGGKRARQDASAGPAPATGQDAAPPGAAPAPAAPRWLGKFRAMRRAATADPAAAVTPAGAVADDLVTGRDAPGKAAAAGPVPADAPAASGAGGPGPAAEEAAASPAPAGPGTGEWTQPMPAEDWVMLGKIGEGSGKIGGGSAGQDAAGQDAAGQDAAGRDAAGGDAAGGDAAGGDAAGRDAAGRDAAGRELASSALAGDVADPERDPAGHQADQPGQATAGRLGAELAAIEPTSVAPPDRPPLPPDWASAAAPGPPTIPGLTLPDSTGSEIVPAVGSPDALTPWTPAGLATLAKGNRREALAVILLALGALLPLPFWLLGAAVAGFSRFWEARYRWVALYGPVLVTVVLTIPLAAIAGGRGNAVAVYVHVIFLDARWLVRVGCILTAAYLIWLVRRGPRERIPPWRR